MSRSDDGGWSFLGEPPDGKPATAQIGLARRVMSFGVYGQAIFPALDDNEWIVIQQLEGRTLRAEQMSTHRNRS
jgi:hypothetical protein